MYWTIFGEYLSTYLITYYNGSYYNSYVKDFHYELIESYRRMYNIFRGLEYDEFLNATYIVLKDLETVRFKHFYSRPDQSNFILAISNKSNH